MSQTEHEHEYGLVVRKAGDGYSAFFFATSPPIHVWQCACGDDKEMTLGEAAKAGFIPFRVVDA